MIDPDSDLPAVQGRLRDDRDFRRYWLSRVVSVTGTVVTAVAMPVLVYRLTGSPTLTALTTTLEAAPYVVVGLLAGAIADRLDRQRLMVAADVVNVVAVGSVPVAWWLGHLAVAHVLVAAFVVQAVFTVFDGANFGALPVLVGRSRVAEANAAVWGVGGVVDLVGPAAAGAVLSVVHPADLLAADAVSYAVSAVLVGGIHRALSPAPRPRSPLRPAALVADVREGLAFLVHHPGVRTLTLVGALQSAAGGGFMALFVPWTDRVLRIGASGWRFGVLYSVWGLGGVAAAVVSTRLHARYGVARVAVWAMPASAVAGVVATLVDGWVAAGVVLVVWGVAYQLGLLSGITYRQVVTPERLLGRVNTTARMLAWGVGWSLGALAAGVLARSVSVRVSMLLVACTAVVGAAVAVCSPLRAEDSVTPRVTSVRARTPGPPEARERERASDERTRDGDPGTA